MVCIYCCPRSQQHSRDGTGFHSTPPPTACHAISPRDWPQPCQPRRSRAYHYHRDQLTDADHLRHYARDSVNTTVDSGTNFYSKYVSFEFLKWYGYNYFQNLKNHRTHICDSDDTSWAAIWCLDLSSFLTHRSRCTHILSAFRLVRQPRWLTAPALSGVCERNGYTPCVRAAIAAESGEQVGASASQSSPRWRSLVRSYMC